MKNENKNNDVFCDIKIMKNNEQKINEKNDKF
jgi:hypothetical protein